MTIYVKSALAGAVAVVIGLVLYQALALAVMWLVLEWQMRAASSEGGGLGAVSVPDYYLPFGAIVVFALGFLWMFRRQRRLKTTA